MPRRIRKKKFMVLRKKDLTLLEVKLSLREEELLKLLLEMSFQRRSFGSVLDIISIVDSVIKFTARCEFCSERASFTLRKTEETRMELTAEAEVYMPVCRKHYVSEQVVKEVAKSALEF
ncbi:thymidine kinase a-like [Capsicum annuum]|uniref:thymidine kinase a-like n=1 Tax=Capsicum annuum TaxID=4072 RepID=UPI0007BEF5BE|nr:thymidine kinase a-like [Capsicum annuum]